MAMSSSLYNTLLRLLTASHPQLNEFRTFFGLEPHKTFESINSDQKIQDALRNLYDSPDMVEMYPGIFVEGIAPDSEGIRFPPAAGRGVLSDAVTLVRSDRFYTLVRIISALLDRGVDIYHRITRPQH